MISLIRKDSGWLLLFLGLGLVVSGTALLSQSPSQMWVIPSHNFAEEVFPFYWISALVFGLFAALREQMTRTADFLRHRPVSVGAIFLAKVVGCFLVLAIWALVPLVLHRGLSEFRGYGPLAEWSRFWGYLGMLTVTGTCFAAGFFLGSFPGNVLRRLILAGPIGFFTVILAYRLLQGGGDGERASLSLFVFAQVGLTGLLLAGAYLNANDGLDEDLPVRESTLWGGIALPAIGAICCLGLGASQVQDLLHLSLRGVYPWMTETDEGRFLLAKRQPGQWKEWRVVGEDHRETGEVLESSDRPVWRYRSRSSSRRRAPLWLEIGGTSFFGPWRRLEHFSRGSAYFDSTTGKVVVVSLGDPALGGLSKTEMSVRPDGEPVSERVQFLGTIEGPDSWIYDPGNPTELLRLSEGPGGLEIRSVSLPGGDEFVAFHRGSMALDDVRSAFRGLFGEDRDSTIYHLVEGKRGSYQWEGGKLVAAAPEVAELVERENRRNQRVGFRDPLRGRIEVTDRKGEVLASHQYELRTASERFMGLGFFGTTLLRSPLLSLTSFLGEGDSSGFRDAVFFEPLLLEGRRAWLLGLHFLVGIGLALMGLVRLKRMGGGGGRLCFWALFLVCGGVGSYLFYRLVETDRRHRSIRPLEVRREEDCLIRTA